MKIQDIVFFIILGILLLINKPRWYVYAGLICLVIAMPLFAGWIFFTAERLTWYAGAFFLLAVLYNILPRRIPS